MRFLDRASGEKSLRLRLGLGLGLQMCQARLHKGSHEPVV